MRYNDWVPLPIHEIEFSFARSSGPGGQNVNKVNSKAILKWDVSQSSFLLVGVKRRFLEKYGNRLNKDGYLILSSDEYRDQSRNKQACLDRLGQMIRSVARPPKKRKPTKPTKGSKEKRLKDKKRKGDIKKMRQSRHD